MQDKAINNTTEKTKKYWSGNIRLFSDFCWSLVITLVLMANGNGCGVQSTPFYFFLFFFWSWNEQHVQKRFARWSIHLLCWTYFVFLFIGLMGIILDKSISIDPEMLGRFSVPFALVIGIAIKYKKLMWPKQSPRKEQTV